MSLQNQRNGVSALASIPAMPKGGSPCSSKSRRLPGRPPRHLVCRWVLYSFPVGRRPQRRTGISTCISRRRISRHRAAPNCLPRRSRRRPTASSRSGCIWRARCRSTPAISRRPWAGMSCRSAMTCSIPETSRSPAFRDCRCSFNPTRISPRPMRCSSRTSRRRTLRKARPCSPRIPIRCSSSGGARNSNRSTTSKA